MKTKQEKDFRGRDFPGFDTPDKIRKLILEEHGKGNYKLVTKLSILYEGFNVGINLHNKSCDPRYIKTLRKKINLHYGIQQEII